MDKIPENHWSKFIIDCFNQTGKTLREEYVQTMIQMTDNHPDYLQQLCLNVWNCSDSEVGPRIIEEAMDMVGTANLLHYQDVCESLSNTQCNLLRAIMAGEKQLNATKTMQVYKLGTPRNVSKNKQTLNEKDILEIHGSNTLFNDPIFEYWLRNKYQN